MESRLPGGRVPERPLVGAAVLAAALVVALVSAHDYAGSMNDGSRLAAVESLVDAHTFAIDGSIFAQPTPGVPGPYRPGEDVFRNGTTDKVFIRGHFYSHTGPVQCLLMAGFYQVLQAATGLTARDRPAHFCYWMTVGSSGPGYVLAVWCIFRLGLTYGLPLRRRLLLTAAFALATLALPYVRNVNNHIVLLGVASALMLGAARLAETVPARRTVRLLLGLGMWAGLGYTLDQAAGPLLLLCATILVTYRCRRIVPVGMFALAALPWVLLHHALNYAIGGTIGPYAAVPEYFRWPGSPFNEQNLTGVWNNHDPVGFLSYAAGLLLGKHGFLPPNLPLHLLVPGAVVLWRCRPREWPELLFAACWCVAVWLAYAAGSTGYSGGCCSIRWFVPLLAPAFYALTLCLRAAPQLEGDFTLLTGWGLAAGALLWYEGPWMEHSIPLLRVLPLFALLHWGVYRLHRRRRGRVPPVRIAEQAPGARAA